MRTLRAIDVTSRRRFALLLGAAAAWAYGARAQQAVNPVVGFLNSGSAAAYARFVAAFRRGLGEAGYVEGQNVTIEYRWAEGRYDRLPGFAAELLAKRIAVIVATGGNAPALAAKAATAAIPIVFATGGDPVRAGIVASLNRPGGNITGVTTLFSRLVQKRLELLRELMPKATSVGAIVNPNYPDEAQQRQELREAANTMKIRFRIAHAADEAGIDSAIASLAREAAQALIFAPDPYFVSRRAQIVALAAHYRLPAIYQGREFAEAGGLLSYGPSLDDTFRQAGIYTGRILTGTRPSELPVLQPTVFELVVNLKTAAVLGITVPQSILVRADDIIE